MSNKSDNSSAAAGFFKGILTLYIGWTQILILCVRRKPVLAFFSGALLLIALISFPLAKIYENPLLFPRTDFLLLGLFSAMVGVYLLKRLSLEYTAAEKEVLESNKEFSAIMQMCKD